MPKALVIVTNSTSQNFAICQKITCLNVAVLKFSSQSIILLFIKRHTTNIPCLTFPDVSANVCTSDYILKKDCKYSSACGKSPFPCQMCAAHKIAPNGARFSRRVVLLARQHGTVKTVPYKPTVRQRAITASSPLIRPRSGPRPPSPVGGRLLGDTPQFHNQSSRFVMLFRLTPSVDALCKSADVAGGRMPMAPRTMRVLLKLMIKR